MNSFLCRSIGGWNCHTILLCALALAFHVHSYAPNKPLAHRIAGFQRLQAAMPTTASTTTPTTCLPCLESLKPQPAETLPSSLLTPLMHPNLTEEDNVVDVDSNSKEEIQVVILSESNDSEALPPQSKHDKEDEANSEESDSHSSHREEASSSSDASSSNNDDDDDKGNHPREPSDAVARAAALLGRKRPRASPSARAGKEKTTSVGARRVGSASKARQKPGSTSKLMDALRNAARGAAAAKSKESSGSDKDKNHHSNNEPNACATEEIKRSKHRNNKKAASTEVSKAAIDSAIGDLLQKNHPKPSRTTDNTAQQGRFMAALKKSVGILGDSSNRQHQDAQPLAGCASGTFVRLATPTDDLDIANLRLSVFSDFSFDQRGQFCVRSCQAIASRRKRGAVCVVATHCEDTNTKSNSKRFRIRGTAECSTHEFHNTQLGRRRPISSILYVTEVAVHPAIRRQGVGSLLLDAIDAFAERRRIESIYLHVDVCNESALSLYQKCGYRKTEDSPVFEEFTKSLNLHPGATKGRSHHLLYKDISQATWLPEDLFMGEPHRVVGKLGFEIPA